MRKFGYVQQVVDDFYQSGEDLAMVVMLPGTYASADSARNAYRNAAKKLGHSIVVRIINGDLYLIRVMTPEWTINNCSHMCSSCARRYPSKECARCNKLSNYQPKEGAGSNASLA